MMSNHLANTLSKDLRTKIRNESMAIVHIVGATDEAFRMLQLVGDNSNSLRGFREFPEGRFVLVYWVDSDADDERTSTIVRMNPQPHKYTLHNLFIDFCDGEFVIVKMMD